MCFIYKYNSFNILWILQWMVLIDPSLHYSFCWRSYTYYAYATWRQAIAQLDSYFCAWFDACIFSVHCFILACFESYNFYFLNMEIKKMESPYIMRSVLLLKFRILNKYKIKPHCVRLNFNLSTVTNVWVYERGIAPQ